MQFPLLVTNFKTYPAATGEKALILAKIHEKVALETGCSIAIAVQTVDLRMIAEQVSIPVFAQHLDPFMPGQYTGFTLAETLRDAHVVGTLINHAEHQISDELIAEAIVRAKECGLFILMCAQEHNEAKRLSKFQPHAIAVEPPELIGGDISVSTANPELISHAVREVPKEIPVLVGAGVKRRDDVEVAIARGAQGVLVASGVVKSDDPEAVLRDLVAGFLKRA
ncbi:MAG: triose-phosphate isomerase [Patescibacteria group bacterium]